ncbi:thiosulfate/3-mercaptopyruvate sulfurtransferase [Actimicrobium sp. GrIS 1.19]|uniref:sulfurtransferase n=1 Tax=Actimicrobium sp. GrIS 1.19 TaxID=3071708 RepID=UPI002DF8A1B7|nr:thiosulfate/3-mercaptopyruvate sulfurtransferase [Actimicrobium sp. GrIS 1.19]
MPFRTLISAANLTLHLNEPNWVVIDCRHDLADPDAGRNAFAAGHIPGARFAHLDTDLSGAKTAPDGSFRGRHPLPEPTDFVQTLRRLGVNQDSQLIAYDAHGGMFAARLWWMLRWLGHARVALLDGGLATWTAAGNPLSRETAAVSPGNFSPAESLTTQVDVAQMQANLHEAQWTVIDARAADRFRGENETLDRVGGHIPGAKNRFFKDNLQADGRFKPGEQLREEFHALIASPANSVMQCGSGVTACHNLLALEVAGMHGAALYPGSWSEWSSDPAYPIATGN